MFFYEDYQNPIVEQTDIVNNPELVTDSGNDCLNSLGWHNDDGESIPYNIDNLGWYEDIRTQDSIIGFILSKKFNTDIKVIMRKAIPNPTDLINIKQILEENLPIGSHPFLYERFEIRSDDRVYSHIVAGTVDYSSDYFLQFEIDDDMNNSIHNLGSSIRKIYRVNPETRIIFRKKIILDYNLISSIESVIHKPIES